ncbi:MAG: DUF2779 domain-containing protein [Steroidobacterales bacterium]
MAWLTKSRFVAGLQCEKRLWFETNQPLIEPQAASFRMLQGRSFDQVVQTLAPGVIIARDKGMPAMIAETTALLRSGKHEVLYQPAFRAGNLAIIADILRKRGTAFQLVEVKSSTSVKPEHIADATYQALVLKNAGVSVSSVSIGHVDNRFVLQHPGDYAGIAVEEDITPQVQAGLQEVADRASGQLEVMRSPEVPDIAMGAHCTSPYPCPFIARCTAARASIPEFPVELLPRGGALAEQLRSEGYEDLRSVPRARLTKEQHLRVYDATVSGTAFFDPAVTKELCGLPAPRSYLDFETAGLAVPEVIGTRPYEAWPFQWSLHAESAAGELAHFEFIDVENFGDFDRLAAALIAAVPPDGPVFVYNLSFERGVLERLADRLPQRATALDAIRGRLHDLLPVTRDAYYHRDMRGSWSIKGVLPTIDPALAYETLEEVREGEAAQLAFLELRDQRIGPARREQLMQRLRDYCRRDTFGLVTLRRFLAGEGHGT